MGIQSEQLYGLNPNPGKDNIMMETLEIGAVNEVDQAYRAVIIGVKRGGGSDHCGNGIEVLTEMSEHLCHYFTFSLNLAGLRSDAAEGTPWMKEDTRTGQDDSRTLCSLIDVEPDYIERISYYGDQSHRNERGHVIPNYNLDPDLLVGKEVGVVIGDYYGERRIKAFIPLADISTMPVPD